MLPLSGRFTIVLMAFLLLFFTAVGLPVSAMADTAKGNDMMLAATSPDDKSITGAGADQQQWKLTADTLRSDHINNSVQAIGSANLTKGKNSLRADEIKFYLDSQWVLLKGNVRAVWGGDYLDAEEAEFDLVNNEGWLKKGKIFLAKPHIYLESQYIKKHKGDTYSFQDAKVTACDGPRPAWSMASSEGEIQLDGEITLWHSRFNILDIPVAYLPWASFPASGKRKSGILRPEFSSSKRNGMGINLPYYWVIDEEKDMTFYENWMSKRGLMQGVEFRHATDLNTKGVWKVDWLNDSKIDRHESDEDSQFQGDGLARKNRDRFWVRSKYNGYLGNPSWRTMVDLDVVSDQNYLREFKYGQSGYDASRDMFVDEFGRGIEDADSLTRTSVAQVSRAWENYGFAAEMRYTQNLKYWNGNNPSSDDSTVQVLPGLDFYAFQTSIGDTPFEFKAANHLDLFWRENGSRGARMIVNPEVSAPVKMAGFTITPRAGFHETLYGVDSHQNSDGVPNESDETTNSNTPNRFFLTGGVDIFTEYFKVWNLDGEQSLEPTRDNVGNSEWARIKHSFIPRVDYSWRDTAAKQSKLPYFDELDRIDPESRVVYSLTNTFNRRLDTVVLTPDGEDMVPTLSSDYLEFLRVHVEQAYDFNEAGRTDNRAQYERRPFGDVLGEIVISPEKYIDLTARNWFSPYLGELTQSENTLTLKREGLGEIWFGYDYQRSLDEYSRQYSSSMNIFRTGFDVDLSEAFTVGAEYRRDLDKDKDLERTIRLLWRRNCYATEFYYTDTDSDERYGVNFDLFTF
ncbi:MAG: LPS-assembly protein LptD [Desulfovibrio sp.]